MIGPGSDNNSNNCLPKYKVCVFVGKLGRGRRIAWKMSYTFSPWIRFWIVTCFVSIERTYLQYNNIVTIWDDIALHWAFSFLIVICAQLWQYVFCHRYLSDYHNCQTIVHQPTIFLWYSADVGLFLRDIIVWKVWYNFGLNRCLAKRWGIEKEMPLCFTRSHICHADREKRKRRFLRLQTSLCPNLWLFHQDWCNH